ncbi:MerR family transcriptional regulator, partial [Vibrio diabolicus]
GKCFLISFEQHSEAESWIQAANLCEQRYHTTFIDKVDDVSGLLEHEVVDSYSLIYLFSNKALAAKQVESIKMLQTRFGERIGCSEVIEKLHLTE